MNENRPRWGRRGRYEAWFLTMSSPDGRSGYWIRHSVRAPIVGPPERRLWFARFDRDDPARTFGLNGSERPDAEFGSGVSRGSLRGVGRQVRWDLLWDGRGGGPRLLPPALYRGSLAPTRLSTPVPEAPISGRIEVDDAEVEIDGFLGSQGHVEGSRHAERWAWMSAGHERGFLLQALSLQARRGPWLTPFLTFAALRIDERWVRFRHATRRRPWELGRWRLRLSSRSLRVEGSVTAPQETMVRARYLDPDDTPRWCHHSAVGSSRFLVWERRAGGWQEVAELASDGSTHAEWAGRTAAPVPMAEHVEVA